MSRAPTCPTPETLSALLDGDLSSAETASANGHLAGCSRCAQTLAELSSLVGAAGTLEALEPPPTLWRAVEGELERPGRWAWLTWRPFAAGAMVGVAGLALALFGLPAVRGRLAPEPSPTPAALAATAPDPLLDEAEAEFARAAADYERSIEKLRALLERAEKGWSPDERTRVAERLTRLDEAIARSRHFARQTPGDSAGNEQLFAAYQQKIAFLTATVHRGDEWRGDAWKRGRP
jgi:putative zinc finger protein